MNMWPKRIWEAFRNSRYAPFVFVPLTFVAFFLALVLIPVYKILETLAIFPMPENGKVIFEVTKKSPKWILEYYNSLSHYGREGYRRAGTSHPPVHYMTYADVDNGSLLKVEFDPNWAKIEDIQNALAGDGLDVVVKESKITPAHRRFFFWTFETRT